ncbi:hypothetical protein NSPZN2_40184 [Nitrospira defluvii]|uniref:Uncharacterized protein n=1 Tax=Nitrospira defluvii TaxID=330214 RepID=A0ABN7LYT8_9BACT|nr:hypothetical protein NSPZN2_40184 [Nitrospira defluvii]
MKTISWRWSRDGGSATEDPDQFPHQAADRIRLRGDLLPFRQRTTSIGLKMTEADPAKPSHIDQ